MDANELINEPHPIKFTSQYYEPKASHSIKRCCMKVGPVLLFISINGLSWCLGYYMSRVTSDGSL